MCCCATARWWTASRRGCFVAIHGVDGDLRHARQRQQVEPAGHEASAAVTADQKGLDLFGPYVTSPHQRATTAAVTVAKSRPIVNGC
jgi:hypothetical protein